MSRGRLAGLQERARTAALRIRLGQDGFELDNAYRVLLVTNSYDDLDRWLTERGV